MSSLVMTKIAAEACEIGSARREAEVTGISPSCSMSRSARSGAESRSCAAAATGASSRAQRRPPKRVAVIRSALPQKLGDVPEQVLRFERLAQKGVGAGRGMAVVPGDVEDGQSRTLLQYPAPQLPAVHPRHPDVGHDEVEPDRVLEREAQRLDPVRGHLDGVPGLVQQPGDPGANDVLVVHHEDSPAGDESAASEALLRFRRPGRVARAVDLELQSYRYGHAREFLRRRAALAAEQDLRVL